MKLILYLFVIFTSTLKAKSLRPGDILLQPRACWSCSLIEAQENSIYSHMGIVIFEDPILIAESLGEVRLVSLEEFNKGTEKGQNLLQIRFKDREVDAGELYSIFRKEFEGVPYDHEFTWGDDKLYCSEFITKLFERMFGNIGLPIKRMKFDINPKEWERYFQGKIPTGKWGNSPGDYEKSALFEHVGIYVPARENSSPTQGELEAIP